MKRSGLMSALAGLTTLALSMSPASATAAPNDAALKVVSSDWGGRLTVSLTSKKPIWKWTLDWPDGSTTSGTGKPPSKISRVVTNALEQSARVDATVSFVSGGKVTVSTSGVLAQYLVGGKPFPKDSSWRQFRAAVVVTMPLQKRWTTISSAMAVDATGKRKLEIPAFGTERLFLTEDGRYVVQVVEFDVDSGRVVIARSDLSVGKTRFEQYVLPQDLHIGLEERIAIPQLRMSPDGSKFSAFINPELMRPCFAIWSADFSSGNCILTREGNHEWMGNDKLLVNVGGASGETRLWPRKTGHISIWDVRNLDGGRPDYATLGYAPQDGSTNSRYSISQDRQWAVSTCRDDSAICLSDLQAGVYRRISLAGGVPRAAVGQGLVWALDGSLQLWRMDPSTRSKTKVVGAVAGPRSGLGAIGGARPRGSFALVTSALSDAGEEPFVQGDLDDPTVSPIP